MLTAGGVPMNMSGVVCEEQSMHALQVTQQAAQAAIQQLQQGQGISLAGDGEQQIFVVTDPAQLEALQVYILFLFYPSVTGTSARGIAISAASISLSVFAGG